MRLRNPTDRRRGFARRGISLFQVVALVGLVAASWYAWNRSRVARSEKPPEGELSLPAFAENRSAAPPVQTNSAPSERPPSGEVPTTIAERSVPNIRTNQVTLPQITNTVRLVRTNSDGSISIPNWIAEPTNAVPYRSHAARSVLDAQVGLARRGISPGPIDGVMGGQTRLAIKAFQKQLGIADTGNLDAYTRRALWVREDPIATYIIQTNDIERLMVVPDTWLGKSELDRLDYQTALEVVAEKGWAYESFIRRLNPGIDWANVPPGTVVKLPNVRLPEFSVKAAYAKIHLARRNLQAFDENGRLMIHFPCSIAQRVDKRPLGELRVATLAPNPVYTFNPAIFTESEEGQRLGRKLDIPPGPNNPVGVAWIGLNREGYGIHGTPEPELVGRTESHGCFRLANWNARLLMKISWVDMPVFVEP